MNESSGKGTLLSTDVLLETLQTVRTLPLPPKAFLLYKQRCLPYSEQVQQPLTTLSSSQGWALVTGMVIM